MNPGPDSARNNARDPQLYRCTRIEYDDICISYYNYIMVFMVNGYSKHFAHVWRKTGHFKFATAVDLSKCFTQTKLPILLYTCAPSSELPSNIGSVQLYM